MHRRTSATSRQALRATLTAQVEDFYPHVITGDLNENVDSNDHWLCLILHVLNFRRCVFGHTTDSNTALDVMFVRNSHIDNNCHILETPFSFHKPLFIKMN